MEPGQSNSKQFKGGERAGCGTESSQAVAQQRRTRVPPGAALVPA